jgi:phosphoenolpyruvate carboxykinase (ATP)
MKYTRHDYRSIKRELDDVAYENHKVFGIAKPQSCPNVPSEILNLRNTWEDPALYDIKAADSRQIQS